MYKRNGCRNDNMNVKSDVYILFIISQMFKKGYTIFLKMYI